MKFTLPAYNTPALIGPTSIARTTMPTKPLLDRTFKYVKAAETDIRKTFKKELRK